MERSRKLLTEFQAKVIPEKKQLVVVKPGKVKALNVQVPGKSTILMPEQREGYIKPKKHDLL